MTFVYSPLIKYFNRYKRFSWRINLLPKQTSWYFPKPRVNIVLNNPDNYFTDNQRRTINISSPPCQWTYIPFRKPAEYFLPDSMLPDSLRQVLHHKLGSSWNWNTLPCWIAFMMPRGARQALGEESQQQCYVTKLPGKMDPLVQQWHDYYGCNQSLFDCV